MISCGLRIKGERRKGKRGKEEASGYKFSKEIDRMKGIKGIKRIKGIEMKFK